MSGILQWNLPNCGLKQCLHVFQNYFQLPSFHFTFIQNVNLLLFEFISPLSRPVTLFKSEMLVTSTTMMTKDINPRNIFFSVKFINAGLCGKKVLEISFLKKKVVLQTICHNQNNMNFDSVHTWDKMFYLLRGIISTSLAYCQV